MHHSICVTCGNQYQATEEPPDQCPICEDERQYVYPAGQSWTTLEALRQKHGNVLHQLEPKLWQITTEPKFGIGQRTLLVQAPNGNVLWDCVSLVDEATISAIEALGGISALAMSHPHMFGSMVEWSHAFDKAPIYLQAAYKQWVPRPDPVINSPYAGHMFDMNRGMWHLTPLTSFAVRAGSQRPCGAHGCTASL